MIRPARVQQLQIISMATMGLTKQELLVLGKSNRGNYSVEIRSKDPGVWQAAIKIAEPENHFDVLTSRGAVKTWRNLADVVLFFQDTCSDCQDVSIFLNNWTFDLRK